MNNETRTLVEQGSTACGLSLDEGQLHQLLVYIQEIELWNPRYKLVSADHNDLIYRHIIDSLAPVPILTRVIKEIAGEHPLELADVGSGNGMPGIPLAVAYPDLSFTLIERSGRRAGFLRNALAVTGLSPRVSLIEYDLSEVKKQFDILIFRAFRPLPDIFDELDTMLIPGGVMFAYKSRKASLDAELEVLGKERLRGYEVQQVPYESPRLNADRRVCIIRKHSR